MPAKAGLAEVEDIVKRMPDPVKIEESEEAILETCVEVATCNVVKP